MIVFKIIYLTLLAEKSFGKNYDFLIIIIVFGQFIQLVHLVQLEEIARDETENYLS